MSRYDKILKEKEVYEDPVIEHSKYTKYIIIYIISIIIIILISYLIYYKTVLSPINIVSNDLEILKNNYKNIYNNIIPTNIINTSSLEGTITLNNNTYNYGLIKEDNIYNLELSNQDTFLYTKLTKTLYSVQLSSFKDNNIVFDNNINYQDLITNFKKKLKNTNYLKNIYLDNTKPVVEINFSYTSKDINEILGTSYLKDNYNIIVTLKNNALTNKLNSLKIIINNTTNNKRHTIEYKNNELNYTTSTNQKYRITISNKSKDFNLKIYKNNELYSVLLGEKNNYKYTYTYQVINKVYNIAVTRSTEKNGYTYSIFSNIEINGTNDEQKVDINLRKGRDKLFEESTSKEITYKSLTKEDKDLYQEKLNTFLLPLKSLIDKYKNNINNLN